DFRKRLIKQIMDTKVETYKFGNIALRREDNYLARILTESRGGIRTIGCHNYHERNSDTPLKHILISRTFNMEEVKRIREHDES
uniref:hypothetical protein n=1 Tax=Leclercia adecarboxylata TaxID=83655 RepID=UPI00301B3E52